MVRGFRAGRIVVTAAAIIMISVFGGFIFSDSIFIVALGLGLAFGVLADAFVVRMLLMPALMHLLGRSAWWIPEVARPHPAEPRHRGRANWSGSTTPSR